MLETTAVLRISTSQMKASARHPERYGHAEPWISAVLRLPDYQHHGPDPCGKPSRYPTQKDAATNTAPIAQKPVGAWSRLTPTPIKTASWRDAEGAKTRPPASQTRPPQDRRDQKPPRCHHLPQILKPPPAKTPWRQRKKSQEIPYGGRLSAGRRDARLYLQPRAPATHRRRRAAPLRKTQGG